MTGASSQAFPERAEREVFAKWIGRVIGGEREREGNEQERAGGSPLWEQICSGNS